MSNTNKQKPQFFDLKIKNKNKNLQLKIKILEKNLL